MLGCFVLTRSASCFWERPAFSRRAFNSCASRYLLNCSSSPTANEASFADSSSSHSSRELPMCLLRRRVATTTSIISSCSSRHRFLLEHVLHPLPRDIEVRFARLAALLLASVKDYHRWSSARRFAKLTVDHRMFTLRETWSPTRNACTAEARILVADDAPALAPLSLVPAVVARVPGRVTCGRVRHMQRMPPTHQGLVRKRAALPSGLARQSNRAETRRSDGLG